MSQYQTQLRLLGRDDTHDHAGNVGDHGPDEILDFCNP